jgi:hypothetical protein
MSNAAGTPPGRITLAQAKSTSGVIAITGGPYDGVSVQVREGEGLNATIGRLLAAMRAREHLPRS